MRCRECLSGRDNLCRWFQLIGEDAPGGYAEKIVVPAQQRRAAAGRRFAVEHAAAVPVTFLTAWQMLTRKARVQPGDDVLVMAAGSGVGTAAVQIAKLHGARVIATASTDDKLAPRARARRRRDRSTTDAGPRRRGEARSPASAASTSSSSTSAAEVWPKLDPARVRKGGKIVTCGATAGFDAQTDLRHVFFRQIEILGSTMGAQGRPVPHPRPRGRRPAPAGRRPRDAAASRPRRPIACSKSGRQFGKIVLINQ